MGWLTRRFRKSEATQTRLIFRYKDGERERAVDPIDVEKVFAATFGDEWRDVLGQAATPIPPGIIGTQADEMRRQQQELDDKVLAAVNVAFDVKAFTDRGGPDGRTEEGLSDTERRGILAGYLRFCNDLLNVAYPFSFARSRASPSLAS